MHSAFLSEIPIFDEFKSSSHWSFNQWLHIPLPILDALQKNIKSYKFWAFLSRYSGYSIEIAIDSRIYAPTAYPSRHGCNDQPVFSNHATVHRLIRSLSVYLLLWPCQEPIYWRHLAYRRPIFQSYVREYPLKKWPYIVQYLHFKILNLPLILFSKW